MQLHHLASSFSDNFAVIDFNTTSTTSSINKEGVDEEKLESITPFHIPKQWVDPEIIGWNTSGFKVTIFFPNASDEDRTLRLCPDQDPIVYWPCYYQNQYLKINQIPAGSIITFILLLSNKNNEGSYNLGWHVVGALPQTTSTTSEYYTKAESDAKFASLNSPTIISPTITGTLTINTDS